MEASLIRNVLEACLLVAGKPMSITQLDALFEADIDRPDKKEIRTALVDLAEQYTERGIELVEVAGGWRLQTRSSMEHWVGRLFSERPPRYSRALLETLVLIAYRQPITRGEIEEVRGVAVSSNIVRTLQEREWVREVGHKDVPGKPALLGTTNEFLDYFNLKRLDDLPALGELKDIDGIDAVLAAELGIVDETGEDAANDGESADEEVTDNDGDRVDGEMPEAVVDESPQAPDASLAVIDGETAVVDGEVAIVDDLPEAADEFDAPELVDEQADEQTAGLKPTGAASPLPVAAATVLAVGNVVPIDTRTRRIDEDEAEDEVDSVIAGREVDEQVEATGGDDTSQAAALSMETVAERFAERAAESGPANTALENADLGNAMSDDVELENAESENAGLEVDDPSIDEAVPTVTSLAQERLLRDVADFADEHRREVEARDAFERSVLTGSTAESGTEGNPEDGLLDEPPEPDDGIP